VRVDLFDFNLPPDRIALAPATPRDAARMLVVGATGRLSDAHVRDFPNQLRPGDALVVNDTRGIAARLAGLRARDGVAAAAAVAIEATLIRRVDERRWRALARPGRRLKVGERIVFGPAASWRAEGEAIQRPAQANPCNDGVLAAEVEDKLEGGEIALRFDLSGAELDAAIDRIGQMPLPNYIAGRRAPDDSDRARYQTMFADQPGAVAAPTAGLHFTPELLAAVRSRGASVHRVTLHVGAGTFLPVKAQDTRDHAMHSEWGRVDDETARALNDARARGGRIVAVGTTSARLLESAARPDGVIAPFSGETAIFMTPGYVFAAVDVLLTNFHLPRSTLFMLVSAFAGLERMKAAYAHAIASGYRFYSYGDACLLERAL
jgi:S-adenosylmethionine:tRNA ribosyltransferase-isomerase